jgi:DNA-directed RNA polymerase
MALQKPDGGIRPILCGEVWRHCFASLAINDTPIRNEEVKLFTSSYDNFIQTAGIRDGPFHCVKILSVFYDNLDTSDPNDPDVIIKIDVSNVFNTTDRVLTRDMISGRVSRDYA